MRDTLDIPSESVVCLRILYVMSWSNLFMCYIHIIIRFFMENFVLWMFILVYDFVMHNFGRKREFERRRRHAFPGESLPDESRDSCRLRTARIAREVEHLAEACTWAVCSVMPAGKTTDSRLPRGAVSLVAPPHTPTPKPSTTSRIVR